MNDETLTLQIDGMTCGGCARSVERAAGRVPGVTTASVDLAKETLTVQLAPPASREAVAKAVTGIGYGVRGA